MSENKPGMWPSALWWRQQVQKSKVSLEEHPGCLTPEIISNSTFSWGVMVPCAPDPPDTSVFKILMYSLGWIALFLVLRAERTQPESAWVPVPKQSSDTKAAGYSSTSASSLPSSSARLIPSCLYSSCSWCTICSWKTRKHGCVPRHQRGYKDCSHPRARPFSCSCCLDTESGHFSPGL